MKPTHTKKLTLWIDRSGPFRPGPWNSKTTPLNAHKQVHGDQLMNAHDRYADDAEEHKQDDAGDDSELLIAVRTATDEVLTAPALCPAAATILGPRGVTACRHVREC